MRVVFVLSLFAALACSSAPAAQPSSTAAVAATDAVAAEEAGRYVGKSVTIEFTVAGVGGSKGSTFINSKPHRPGSEDFVAYVPSSAKAAFSQAFGEDLRAAFSGKRIRVTGEVVMFKGQPEIVLKSPDQLQVVQ